MLLSLAAHLAAGIVLGMLYFRGLWWNVRQFTGGGRAHDDDRLDDRPLRLLGALLTLASLEGALPLLMMALGVLIARSAVVRRVREAAP